MQDKVPCEQFGSQRAEEIDALIQAATGHPCPGRMGARCPFDAQQGGAKSSEPHLRAV